ncbi:hypothetical protein JKP88DRAFT_164642, partial [Tribonema minus]
YVGDSVTDMLAMLSADVGIVIGDSATFRDVAYAFGGGAEGGAWMGVQGENRGKSPGRVYAAASWADIEELLFGTCCQTPLG